MYSVHGTDVIVPKNEVFQTTSLFNVGLSTRPLSSISRSCVLVPSSNELPFLCNICNKRSVEV